MIYFANYQFSEPISLIDWKTEDRDGIYAILIKDPKAKSQPFKAIDFGESDNLSDSRLIRSHQRFGCWIQVAGNEADLYVAAFSMPGSASELREGIVAFLVKYYHPVCNIQAKG